PATGDLTLGGTPLETATGLVLDGFNGTATLTALADSEAVQLDGTAARILGLFGSPSTISTDQDTTQPLRFRITTSLADTYNVIATAPEGWAIIPDGRGMFTITPAPGLQSGTFPIRLIAQSTTHPDLLAQSVVNVTVTPTQRGIRLSVAPDTLFTVP